MFQGGEHRPAVAASVTTQVEVPGSVLDLAGERDAFPPAEEPEALLHDERAGAPAHPLVETRLLALARRADSFMSLSEGGHLLGGGISGGAHLTRRFTVRGGRGVGHAPLTPLSGVEKTNGSVHQA